MGQDGAGAELTVRVVDNGKVVTSAGIATGIEAALHVVGKLLGQPQAEKPARYMEYAWQP